jgi:hypothetical protein
VRVVPEIMQGAIEVTIVMLKKRGKKIFLSLAV